MKIGVLIKEPGRKPRHVNISNTLENLQKTVGGYIETITLSSDFVILCDEEGCLKEKGYNCTLCGVSFVGTIVLCGVKGDEFSNLPVAYSHAKKVISQSVGVRGD